MLTVPPKPKGLCAPLGAAFTEETFSDPDTAWHLTLSCQERLFPPASLLFLAVLAAARRARLLPLQQCGSLSCTVPLTALPG